MALVENYDTSRHVMQFSTAARLIAKQTFEKLDIRSDHNRSDPVFSSPAALLQPLFVLIVVCDLRKTVMLEDFLGIFVEL
ncbi:MAG: hypothetical protein KY475_09760, partial [Planctomycetes bacterium]|nr:hypothetical protein [Planctomycetota bacterium]